MKTIIITAILALSSSLTFAADSVTTPESNLLKFSNGQLQAVYTWKQGPQTSTKSVLLLNWQNANFTPVEPQGSLKVTLSMPMMPGMQSPPTKITNIVDGQGQATVGAYEVSNIYFTMGGDWDVQVTLTYPNGAKETQVIKVHLSGM